MARKNCSSTTYVGQHDLTASELMNRGMFFGLQYVEQNHVTQSQLKLAGGWHRNAVSALVCMICRGSISNDGHVHSHAPNAARQGSDMATPSPRQSGTTAPVGECCLKYDNPTAWPI